jgi:H+/Cl- antiporter ClcA
VKKLTPIMFVYGFVLSVCYAVPVITDKFLINSSELVNGLIATSLYVITISYCFFLLRVNLDKKYKNSINYWKYVIIGFFSSILSIIFYQFGEKLYHTFYAYGSISYSIIDFLKEYINGIFENLLLVIYLPLPLCLIVGLLYIFYKKRKKN